MAKRSCRRTTDENLIHKKAVEMRKKTDEQLVRRQGQPAESLHISSISNSIDSHIIATYHITSPSSFFKCSTCNSFS